MKLVTGTLLLFFVIAGVASAQTPSLPTFSHIIIIVQENRTPDNLFGSLASGPCNSANSLPGADLVNGGIGIVKGQQGKTCNTQLAMNFGQDPTHYHQDWINDYDAGLMDGFCDSPEFTWPNCPPYSYVQASDVQPYIAIANTYGFANYMFQTNEGPSFEAHQFLFTGTAAPVAPNDPNGYYWDFLTDNPNFSDSGCTASTHLPLLIQPDGTTTGPGVNYECYTHDSLVTSSTCNQGVCDKNVSWRYYTPTTGIIWDAPESIPEVCYGENDLKNAGGACGSASSGNQAEWKKHMSFYSSYNFAPIFNDIQSCQLAQISWVIPDISWSDHPEANGTGPALGPSWVGNIINAIGNSYASSNQLCDYWVQADRVPPCSPPRSSWCGMTGEAFTIMSHPQLC
jgi:phospholipase C